MSGQPGEATAFEGLVDHYDAARPRYPAALFAALPLAGARVLELGAGTGIATAGLRAAGADVVATDLGPRMLGRAVRVHAGLAAVVARAEALPFSASSFDGVVGAQMWHWVDVPAAAAAVARVLRPGGWLALAWNGVDPVPGTPFAAVWEAQQQRLEAGNARYRRDYRMRDFGEELAATGRFAPPTTWAESWSRTLDWPLYERWLRSKSYVQALADAEGFVAAERASVQQAFPDGQIVEPFSTRLLLARRSGA